MMPLMRLTVRPLHAVRFDNTATVYNTQTIVVEILMLVVPMGNDIHAV